MRLNNKYDWDKLLDGNPHRFYGTSPTDVSRRVRILRQLAGGHGYIGEVNRLGPNVFSMTFTPAWDSYTDEKIHRVRILNPNKRAAYISLATKEAYHRGYDIIYNEYPSGDVSLKFTKIMSKTSVSARRR